MASRTRTPTPLTGTFNVQVTVTDEFGFTSPAATQTITISSADMEGNDLYVGDQVGHKSIVFTPESNPGEFDVTLGGQDLGLFTPSAVDIYAVPSDTVTINGSASGNTFAVDPNGVVLNGLTFIGNGGAAWDLVGDGRDKHGHRSEHHQHLGPHWSQHRHP